ncbi:MAG: fibronectin type III domain-containing protein, partial [Prevotella sp.]|nr:fibronectin type III domain-containing protein [Prevotella sp.]
MFINRFKDYYCRSQYVIPAAELTPMNGATIYSITYYGYYYSFDNVSFPYTTSASVNVYMKEVGYSTMTSFEEPSTATNVYSGQLTFTGDKDNVTLIITLTTPFTYHGGNLLIGMDNTTHGNQTEYSPNFYGQYLDYAVSVMDYSQSPNPLSLDGGKRYAPKTTFTYIPAGETYCNNKPTSVSVSNITTTSADVTWQGASSSWNLRYKLHSSNNWTEVKNLTAKNYHLTGLTSGGTSYDVGVRGICGATSTSTWFTTHFVTDCGVISTYPWTFDFDSHENTNRDKANNLPTCWHYINTSTDDGERYLPAIEKDSYNAHSGTNFLHFESFDNGNGNPQDQYAILPQMTNLNGKRIKLYARAGGDASDYQDATFKVGMMTDPTDAATFTELASFTPTSTNYEMYSVALNVNSGSYAAIKIDAAKVTKDWLRRSVYIDDIAVEDIPQCQEPTGLTITYSGGNTAVASWTSEESAWDISVNGTVTENVTNPYTLTGLQYATTYEVKVRSRNGDTVSTWSSPVSFSTDLSAEFCQISFELTGEGWSGKYIKVEDVLTSRMIGTIAMLGGTTSTNGVLSVPNGREVMFEWVGEDTDKELSYVVKDVNGDELFSGSEAMTKPVVYTVDCSHTTLKKPTDFEAYHITPHSAQLKWTENNGATAWGLAYKTEDAASYTEVNTTANTFAMSSLEPKTTYCVKVRSNSNSGMSHWTTVLSFTTPEQYPRPELVAASDITYNAATIGWEGFADSYDLKYRKYVEGDVQTDFDDSTFGGWTTIDADGDGYSWEIYSKSTSKIENPKKGKGHDASADFVTSAIYWDPSEAQAIYLNPSGAMGVISGQSTSEEEVIITANNYLVSPKVILGGTISFWVNNEKDSDLGAFEVFVSTTSNTDPSAFRVVWRNTFNDSRQLRSPAHAKPLTESDGWRQFTVDLSEFSGEGYVAIRFFNMSDFNKKDLITIHIDDIKITRPASAGEGSPWSTVNDINGNSSSLTGLDDDEVYDVQVRGNYGSTIQSTWKSLTFKTAEKYPSPTALSVSNVKYNEVTLNWDHVGTSPVGHATAWQICVNGDEEHLTDVSTKPFTLTGLSEETTYSVKIRAVYADGNRSKWSSAFSFTTAERFATPTHLTTSYITGNSATVKWTGDASSYSLRYSKVSIGTNSVVEGFEDEQVNWTTFDNDYVPLKWERVSGSLATGFSAHGGDYVMVSRSSTAELGEIFPDNYLVSPQVSLGGTLTFYAANIANEGFADFKESFGVAVSTKSNNKAADFTTFWTSDILEDSEQLKNSQDGWYRFTVDLSAYTGMTGYVAIRHFNADGKYMLVVDDVTITQPAYSWTNIENINGSSYGLTGLMDETFYIAQVRGCYDDAHSKWGLVCFNTSNNYPAPTALSASEPVGAFSVTLNWTENGNANAWLVAHKADGAQDFTMVSAKSKPFELKGLRSETHYTVKVSPHNSANFINWGDEISFTTAVYWMKPSSLEVVSRGRRSVKLKWHEEGAAQAWVVAYKAADDTDFTEVKAKSNPYTLDELTPETQYTVKVRPDNDEDIIRWSDELTFTTDDYWVKPTGLTASAISFSGATLSWTEEGEAEAWVVAYKAGSAEAYTEATVETCSFTLTGLTPETPYNVKVRPVNDKNIIVWSDEMTFTTAEYWLRPTGLVASDVYPHSAELRWTENGPATAWVVAYKAANDADFTEKNTSENPFTLSGLTPGSPYTLKVRPANDEGVIKWSDEIIFTPAVNIVPIDVAVNASATRAVISWKGYGDSYNIDYRRTGEWKTVSSTENTVTLTGLTPTTYYIYRIQSVKGDNTSEWTSFASFTTQEAPSVPTGLAVSTTPTTATIGWTGNGDSYNIQYRDPEAVGNILLSQDFENGLGGWTRRGCVNNSNVYSGDGLPKHSGSFVFTFNYRDAGSPQYLISPELTDVTEGTKLAFYYSNWLNYTETFHVGYSTTGSDTENFTFGPQITVSDNQWHLYRETIPAGTKYICLKCTSNKYNLCIDDIRVYQVSTDWTNCSSTAPTVTITGLTPSTTYEYRVQTVVNGENSEWTASATFTTLVENPVPTDLTVSSVSSLAASLCWTGYGDSYNMKWRRADHVGDDLFVEGFENGIGQWTLRDCGPNSKIYSDTYLPIHSGKSIFHFSCSSGTSNKIDHPQYLISPMLTGVTAGSKLEFYYTNCDGSTETFHVGYSTTGNAIADFTFGNEISASGQQWRLYSGAIPADTKYVCVKYTSNKYNLAIDDVRVYAEAAWATLGTMEPAATLTGLEPSTGYEYQVQSVKNDKTSAWSALGTFTTADAPVIDTLGDDCDNSATIAQWASDGKSRNIMLDGRTLYKDGDWNTLCLPFSMTADEVTAQLSPTELKELDTTNDGTYAHATGLDHGTLYLNFKDATAIRAGVPYLIRWDGDGTDNLVNPLFSDVTIAPEYKSDESVATVVDHAA